MHEFELLVLGSAAGGGFPQWNCGCANCAAVRRGDARFEARSEDSLALTSSEATFLVNASAGISAQLARHRTLWPRARRDSPVKGIVLTNGDLDHTLGLFVLREWQPLVVYATDRVREGVQENSMLRTLLRVPGQLVWRRLELDQELELEGPRGEKSDIRVTPFSVPGKPPLHREPRTFDPEDNVALSVRGPRGRFAIYASATADLEAVAARWNDCELLLLDGTFWSESEPLELGAPHGARAMGHLPMSGPGGSLSASCPVPERWFTHVNNTNPALDGSSAERMLVTAGGWDLARDGQSFLL